MTVRYALKKDIPDVIRLLSQVLEIHAGIRPDIYKSGTTKYSPAELEMIFNHPERRTLIAADENDRVLGYAFCEIKQSPDVDCMVKRRFFYIDDLCVDEKARGRGIGKVLFERCKEEAKSLGLKQITLNVWAGNKKAEAFYEKMGMKPLSTMMETILPEQ